MSRERETYFPKSVSDAAYFFLSKPIAQWVHEYRGRERARKRAPCSTAVVQTHLKRRGVRERRSRGMEMERKMKTDNNE